jgi:hypothetical protein
MLKKIKLTIEIGIAAAEAILERDGYKIYIHDFGRWESQIHNRPVWVESNERGIMLRGEWLTIEEAFNRLYIDRIGAHFSFILSKSDTI